jgi:NAD-dependent dihydropyrimidine dehydrogenase PreA subunit
VKTKSGKGNFAIEINHPLCGECGACVAVCPENILHLGTLDLISDDDDCTGCNFCIITCPSDALKLIKLSENESA